MKRRTVTVGRCTTIFKRPAWDRYRYRPNSPTVPMVRLSGRWLAREGFREGEKYSVEALPGTLTLTLAERPPRKDYSPEEAQVLLGNLARRLEEIKALLEEIRDGLPHSPEEDRMLEVEIPSDLATELHGTIESVVDDDLASAIKQLTEASQLTDADLARQFEKLRAERAASKRIFAAIAPRVVEIMRGDRPKGRRPPRKPKIH